MKHFLGTTCFLSIESNIQESHDGKFQKLNSVSWRDELLSLFLDTQDFRPNTFLTVESKEVSYSSSLHCLQFPLTITERLHISSELTRNGSDWPARSISKAFLCIGLETLL